MNLPAIYSGMRFEPIDTLYLGYERGNLVLAVAQALCNARIVRGPRDEVFINSHGIVIQLQGVDGDTGTGVAGVARFKISSIFDDYVIARTFDGSVVGDTDYAIAKDPHARTSISSISYSGITFSISYSGNNQRTLTNGTGGSAKVLHQRLYMPYTVNDIIHAAIVVNGSGVSNAPDYLEISPSRRWETDLTEFDVCDDDGTHKALFPASDSYDP
jgi:hypothetical protein